MKKFFLFFLLFVLINSLYAQNGLTNFMMPSGYTNLQLRYKNALAIDNTNNKWIAFQSIGVGKFDGSNWTMFDSINSGLPSMYTTSLAVDQSNVIWVGTHRGLAKYNGSSWTVYNKSNSGITSDTVITIAVNGNSVYAGSYKGVSVFNGGTWTTYSKTNSGIASDTIQAITVEPGGTIWFGTPKGLSRFAGSTWATFNHSNSGLISNNILCLYYDGNKLWMGTNGGGIHQYSGGSITPLDSLNPIPPFQYPTVTYAITKGFNGGILFDWNGVSLAEFISSPLQTKLYAGAGNSGGSAGKLFQKDASGLLWFINRLGSSSPANNLFSFNFSNYVAPVGPGYITPDNLKMLDINKVNAGISDIGSLHWQPATQRGLYEVPKGSGMMSIFASAFWIGAVNAGNLMMAAQMYLSTGSDFWPGPLDTMGNATITPTVMAQYDKVWKINRSKVEEFRYYWANGNVQNGTYTPDHEILSWPGNGNTSLGQAKYLAPFVDVNHNGIYDPLVGGDYPKIKGDQMLWWVFNDKGNTHGNTQGQPLGVEVHASAYSYNCPQIADSLQIINYTTLYHYEIFNRSSLTLDSAYIGNWQDGDLGCATDDFVGCNPSGNYGYYYNGTNNDVSCSGELGYGLNPPVSSTIILDGPPAKPGDGIDNNNNGATDEPGEKNLMTDFAYYFNTAPAGMSDPSTASEYYNYLSGTWKDHTPFTYGGSGHGGSTPTHFMFPDFPGSGWNETTAGNTPGDRRYLMSTGPFSILPRAEVDYDYAIVWSRDTTLTSQQLFAKNYNDNMKIKQWFMQDNFPYCSCNITNSLVLKKDTVNPLLWFGYDTITGGTPPYTYVWNFGDGDTSTLAYPTHTYSVSGHYAICVTVKDANGCTSYTCDSTYKISSPGIIKYLNVVNTLGIASLQNGHAFTISPNPTNGVFKIQMENGQLPITNYQLSVYGVMGEKVYSTIINSSSSIIELVVPNGIYFLQLKTAQGITTKKIIIHK